MRTHYVFTYFFTALLPAGCGSKSDKKDAGPAQAQPQAKGNTIVFNDAQIKNGDIETGKLPEHQLSSTIHVNGKVDVPPENIISVNVPMGGFLKRTAMLPGEPVHKGQVLAEIENQDYITLQQDYLTAISRIVFLKQELERQSLLSQQQASPLRLYQQTQADYSSEVAQAAGTAQKLRMLGINPQKLMVTNIRATIPILSPINGFVSQVNVNIGKYINATDVLMELVDTRDIHAALTVFEQDIPKLVIGNPVQIYLPSLPDKNFPGKVILIGRMLDSSHSVLVHCHFLSTDPHLLPNMFLQAAIATKPVRTTAVPDEALVHYSGKDYIYMVGTKKRGMQFTLIPVSVGIKEGGWNEIQLDETKIKNKTFVLKGAFAILSAMKNTGDED